MPNGNKSGSSAKRTGLVGYTETASTAAMRAVARIALSRGQTQTSLAQMLAVHSSNVRRHFEGKARQGTVDLYINRLGRNEIDRKLMREYFDVVEGRFDVEAVRGSILDDLRAQEPAFREGALPKLISAIEKIDDSSLQPALQAYLGTKLEMSLFLTFPSTTLEASSVERELGLDLKVFADAIHSHVDVAAFLAQHQPAEDRLWHLWVNLRLIPGTPFSDEDAEAIVSTAVGRLSMRGVDTRAMLRHLARQREHLARQEARVRPKAAQPNATTAKRRSTK